MDETLTLTDSLENLGLKDKTQEELSSRLIESEKWTEDEKRLVSSAYELALNLHQHDQYKDQPYIYHLLRVANRITGYLRIHDAEIVAATLLHDSVEDHAVEISQPAQDDMDLQQQAALAEVSARFSPRVAELVGAVTNEPSPKDDLTYDEKLARYAAKVRKAVSTPDGWIFKFSDWCDNGLGIAHGVQSLSSEQIAHFQHKYGGDVLDTLEQRFHEPDIQEKLDWAAKGYVEHQLTLGHQRLIDNQRGRAT